MIKPFMTATPRIEMNPTAAEMLKFSPAIFNAHTPPTPTPSTFANTTAASSHDRNAKYRNTAISTSETRNIRAIRFSASSICLNSPLHSVRYGMVMSGSTLALASATVLAEVAAADLELDGDQPLALLPVDRGRPRAAGTTPAGSGRPLASSGVTRSPSRRTGTAVEIAER